MLRAARALTDSPRTAFYLTWGSHNKLRFRRTSTGKIKLEPYRCKSTVELVDKTVRLHLPDKRVIKEFFRVRFFGLGIPACKFLQDGFERVDGWEWNFEEIFLYVYIVGFGQRRRIRDP